LSELSGLARLSGGGVGETTLSTAEVQKRDTTADARRNAVLIVNAHARSGADQFATAKRLLQEKGFALGESFAVQEPKRIPALVARAVQDRHSLIIVGGGDGTISCAINELAGKDVTCGLLPLGTANSFARSLNLPLDLEGAIDVLANGRAKHVDLGCINGRYFATAAAIGLSTEIQRSKPHVLKRVLGPLAYPTIAAAVLPKFKPFACTLTLGNGERRDLPSALELRIANAPYEGGVEASPDASLTSGDLVVHIVSGTSKWRLIKTWAQIVGGMDPRGPGYETLRAKSLQVVIEPVQHVNVDGEAALRTPLSVSIARKALRVMVPR
jgi:YegS/Rv2252/BmrU family lipid kinase